MDAIKIELGKKENFRTFRYYGTITNKSTIAQKIHDMINNVVFVDGIHNIINIHITEFVISSTNSLEFGELDKMIFEIENNKHVTIPFYMKFADDKTSLVVLNYDKECEETIMGGYYSSILYIYGLKSDGTIISMNIEPGTKLSFDITYSYTD